jgi:hypothetical protein
MEYAENLDFVARLIREWGFHGEIAYLFLEQFEASDIEQLTPDYCLEKFPGLIGFEKMAHSFQKDVIAQAIQVADWREIREMVRRDIQGYDHPDEDPSYNPDSVYRTKECETSAFEKKKSPWIGLVRRWEISKTLADLFLEKFKASDLKQLEIDYFHEQFLQLIDFEEIKWGFKKDVILHAIRLTEGDYKQMTINQIQDYEHLDEN